VVQAWLTDNPGGQKVLDAYRKIYADVIAGR
jgi:hypothetical protein